MNRHPLDLFRRLRRQPGRALLVTGLLATVGLVHAPAGATQAFRISDLDLRDPHVFVSYIGCRDITDNALTGFSFNGDLQDRIQGDTDMDGWLDQSWLLVWDAIDPALPSDSLVFISGQCTAPLAGTSCQSGFEWSPVVLRSTQTTSGFCLSALAGTARPYTPAITGTGSPCFASDPKDMQLVLANGMIFPLRDAQIGATFSGQPPALLVNGLIRGFLTEADANATILPSSMPLVGGLPLSMLFPGGDPPGSGINCASYSDKDIGPGGEAGWWVYFNFFASPVPYSGPALAVGPGRAAEPSLEVWPNPARASATIWFERPGGGPVDVAIYDLTGRRIRALFAGTAGTGARSVRWDGRDRNGAAAPSGVYFVRLFGGAGQPQVRSFVLTH